MPLYNLVSFHRSKWLVDASENPGVSGVLFYVFNCLLKLSPRLSVLFGDRRNSQLKVLRLILDVVSEVLY